MKGPSKLAMFVVFGVMGLVFVVWVTEIAYVCLREKTPINDKVFLADYRNSKETVKVKPVVVSGSHHTWQPVGVWFHFRNYPHGAISRLLENFERENRDVVMTDWKPQFHYSSGQSGNPDLFLMGIWIDHRPRRPDEYPNVEATTATLRAK